MIIEGKELNHKEELKLILFSSNSLKDFFRRLINEGYYIKEENGEYPFRYNIYNRYSAEIVTSLKEVFKDISFEYIIGQGFEEFFTGHTPSFETCASIESKLSNKIKISKKLDYLINSIGFHIIEKRTVPFLFEEEIEIINKSYNESYLKLKEIRESELLEEDNKTEELSEEKVEEEKDSNTIEFRKSSFFPL